jgi:hypothetical protein
MDLLDEIEGAITEDGHQPPPIHRNIDNAYRIPRLPYQQHPQHFQPPPPPFASQQTYHQQPEHLNYDQPPGMHLGSSSSYSQGENIRSLISTAR